MMYHLTTKQGGINIMTKKELNELAERNNYIPGGTKQACLVVKEFLQHATPVGNGFYSTSSVSIDEFRKAVDVLMAFAFQKKDEIPERWGCETDCVKTSCPMCLGEFNVDNNSLEACPYYEEEDK